MPDDFIGFDFRLIAAGLSGAIVDACLERNEKLKDVLIRLAVGALSANYLSPSFPDLGILSPLAKGFLVGAGGVYICKRAIRFYRSKVSFKD
jgi:hypothetical protein